MAHTRTQQRTYSKAYIFRVFRLTVRARDGRGFYVVIIKLYIEGCTQAQNPPQTLL